MKCRQCGRCCEDTIVEFDIIDVRREPKLKKYWKWGNDYDKIGTFPPGPCPFLKKQTCSIYPTRPAICVAFDPGSRQCLFGVAQDVM